MQYITRKFWQCYKHLPEDVQKLTIQCYKRLKANPADPSLHIKHIGKYYSMKIGHYKALGVEIENNILWFWIGIYLD